MTVTKVDPYQVPEWIKDPKDRSWWEAMVLAIESIKADADRFYEAGMLSAKAADRARADYSRLRQENRDRYAAKGVSAVEADGVFSAFQVAKDCIDAEQMNGRWSQDRLAASRAAYAQVTRLQGALSGFMRQHAPRVVPRQRAGGEP